MYVKENRFNKLIAFYSLRVLIQNWNFYGVCYHNLAATFPENCYATTPPLNTWGGPYWESWMLHKHEVCLVVNYIAEILMTIMFGANDAFVLSSKKSMWLINIYSEK